jgi:hypothetical protein
MPFEFQPTLETLDEVPQNYRALYSQGESGFTLDGVLAKKLDVSGLTSALDKERKNVKTLNGLVASFKNLGETPEAVQQKLQELQEAATSTKEGKANWDKMKADLEAGHKRALDASGQQILGMKRTLESHLIDAEAVKEIAEAKGSSQLLLPHIRSQVKVIEEGGKYVVRIVDAEGDPRGDSKGGFMTIKDLVAEMKTSDSYSRAFDATGTGGSGKQPGNGGKPNNQQQPTTAMDKIRAGLAKRGR